MDKDPSRRIVGMNSQEQDWEEQKQICLIRHYVRNPHLARAKLKKMDSEIKRDSKGNVAKKDMDKYRQMELFRDQLNIERGRKRGKCKT